MNSGGLYGCQRVNGGVDNASDVRGQAVAYFFVFLAPYIRDMFCPVCIARVGRHHVTFTFRSTFVLHPRSEQQNVPIPHSYFETYHLHVSRANTSDREYASALFQFVMDESCLFG